MEKIMTGWLIILASANAALKVHQISIDTLDCPSGDDLHYIRHAIAQDGILEIVNHSPSTDVRILATMIESCVKSGSVDFPLPDVFRTDLADGSTRSTFAMRSNTEFDSCNIESQKAVSLLQWQMDKLGNKFAKVLDVSYEFTRVFVDGTTGSHVPRNYSELVAQGDNLDHFHVYSSNTSSTRPSDALHMHIDMGLFLVLSPAIRSGPSGISDELRIRRQDGSVFAVKAASDNSFFILIGGGLSNWLRVPNVRACMHSVAAIQPGSSRVVFGRMFLPPPKAFVYHGHEKSTFASFFHAPRLEPTRLGSPAMAPAAQAWRRLMDQQCAQGEVYCWMQCMGSPECGASAVCWDEVHQDLCPADGGHHPECNLKCPPNSSASDAPASQFCYGRTSMIMSGFASVASAGSPCVILLFQGFVLDSPTMFALGCVLSIIMGIFVEGIIKVRRAVSGSKHAMRPWLRDALIILLFGLNVAVGYACMLVAMTYNVELFVCVVVGLCIGHSMFSNSRQPVRESADPCCVTVETERDSVPACSKRILSHTGG